MKILAVPLAKTISHSLIHFKLCFYILPFNLTITILYIYGILCHISNMYKEIYKLKWQHKHIERPTIRPIVDALFCES